jgi:hypothetical protein
MARHAVESAPSGQMKSEAVLADHTQPIHRQRPPRLRVDLARGRWGWEVARSYAPPLPSFRTVLERVEPSPSLDEAPVRFAQGGYGPRRLPYPNPYLSDAGAGNEWAVAAHRVAQGGDT